MKRRTFLYSTAGGSVAAAAQAPSGPLRSSGAPPNFLFILFDMCRRDAIGAYGINDVYSPNIDRLASEGVRFDNCYTTQALCGPARASIITGLYPHSHGVTGNVYPTKGFFAYDLFHEPIPNPFLDARFHLWDNFPFLLLNAGYETGYIGKWHLGITNPGFFNTWKGFNSGLPHWIGKPHASEYRPDVETDDAVDFIEKNANRRFFLYTSYYPPHAPIDPPKKFLDYYQGKSDPRAGYHAAVSNLDWNVGRLIAALEKHKILDRTFIILATEHGRVWEERPGTVNGYDNSYEGAAHIPLILRHPGSLPSGRVWKSGVTLADLAPTILEAANITAPPMHGRSLLPILRSGNDEWTRPLVIQNVAGKPIGNALFKERAIRDRKWKMILRKFDIRNHPADELYDMEADPGETKNLFGRPEGRATVRELGAALRQWGDELSDPLAVELGRRAEAG
jgi:arylsulfatase A-like enzyme